MRVNLSMYQVLPSALQFWQSENTAWVCPSTRALPLCAGLQEHKWPPPQRSWHESHVFPSQTTYASDHPALGYRQANPPAAEQLSTGRYSQKMVWLMQLHCISATVANCIKLYSKSLVIWTAAESSIKSSQLAFFDTILPKYFASSTPATAPKMRWTNLWT